MHTIYSRFATSRGLVHLVKQSRSSPHETFHIATNATLNPDEKTTGATIGYNVCVSESEVLKKFKFESRWSPDFFQASSFQLPKLENLLRWSHFTFIYYRSTNMNYFIYISHDFTAREDMKLSKLTLLFISELVEHRTGIAEVMGSNPVEALIFFRLLLSNCLNWKIYCDDHTSLSSTTAVQIWIISYIFPNVCVANHELALQFATTMTKKKKKKKNRPNL